MKISVLLCLSMFFPANAVSCFAPPVEAVSSPYDLVNDAKYIVLARVESKLGGGAISAEFLLETQEVLKGEAPRKFTFNGSEPGENLGRSADYDAHTDPEFWASLGGNSTITTFCVVMGIFEVGQSYLVIGTEYGHFKAYENIRSDDDLWLKVVRLLVEDSR